MTPCNHNDNVLRFRAKSIQRPTNPFGHDWPASAEQAWECTLTLNGRAEYFNIYGGGSAPSPSLGSLLHFITSDQLMLEDDPEELTYVTRKLIEEQTAKMERFLGDSLDVLASFQPMGGWEDFQDNSLKLTH